MSLNWPPIIFALIRRNIISIAALRGKKIKDFFFCCFPGVCQWKIKKEVPSPPQKKGKKKVGGISASILLSCGCWPCNRSMQIYNTAREFDPYLYWRKLTSLSLSFSLRPLSRGGARMAFRFIHHAVIRREISHREREREINLFASFYNRLPCRLL